MKLTVRGWHRHFGGRSGEGLSCNETGFGVNSHHLDFKGIAQSERIVSLELDELSYPQGYAVAGGGNLPVIASNAWSPEPPGSHDSSLQIGCGWQPADSGPNEGKTGLSLRGRREQCGQPPDSPSINSRRTKFLFRGTRSSPRVSGLAPPYPSAREAQRKKGQETGSWSSLLKLLP